MMSLNALFKWFTNASHLTSVLGILGGLTGPLGLWLAFQNYRRDRAKVKVDLEWDAREGPDLWSSDKITVTNTGRRPIHINRVCLRTPYSRLDACDEKHRSGGITLEEGAPPHIFWFEEVHNLSALEQCSKVWKKIKAEATDSAGRVYLSKRRKMKTPSWVKKVARIHSQE